MSRTICVVEPHADDAFLSLGQHIEDWIKGGDRVTIWTVFSGTRKRAADAQAYAKAVGAEWMGSDFVEGQVLDAGRILDLLPEANHIVVPLGLTHPEHEMVRDTLTCTGLETWYYLDQPYAITQKNGPMISGKLFGHKVISYRKPGVRKYRHIPLFKDQAKFFHYNTADKLIQTCELIVS